MGVASGDTPNKNNKNNKNNNNNNNNNHNSVIIYLSASLTAHWRITALEQNNKTNYTNQHTYTREQNKKNQAYGVTTNTGTLSN
jgi:hypothetical protein